MCGIAGQFAYAQAAPAVDRAELLAIRDHMVRRGPDGEGLWLSADGTLALAHRRLAIIDLTETGAQPMASDDGRYRITFNGEIYNYRQLRSDLEGHGRRFRSTSDTEVLLQLYAQHGGEMVGLLRGMFAFAIWDERERTLFLARDAFGIKPLYYADDGKSLRFASQVKALMAGGRIDSRPSAAGHVGFYLWGHVPEPYTLFESVKAVPAGHTLKVGQGGARTLRRFFDVSEEFAKAAEKNRVPAAERQERVRAALLDSVRHHLVADVPVGVFLSSGLDSTALTALARESGAQNLQSVTLGFHEYRGTRDDETPLAELAARCLATQHQTRWVSKNQFEEELPRIIDAMDQPSIDGVNTYLVSRAAAASGMKVALSGVGGDELFGGYPSFRDVPLMARLLQPAVRLRRMGRWFRRVTAPMLGQFTSPKFAGLLEYGGTYAGAYLLRRGMFMPWELPRFLDPALARAGLSELQTHEQLEQTVRGCASPFQKVSALELSWYMRNQLLRDSDWAGMAHSLEIRVPFVDVELFRALAPLSVHADLDKRLVARSPAIALPDEILDKPKTGFSIPVSEWLQANVRRDAAFRGLRAWARILNPSNSRSLRLLALATDAFGGHGGIAKFNRDLLRALCSHPRSREVVAIPRLMPGPPEPLPPNLTHVTSAINSKVRFVSTVLSTVSRPGPFDLVVCGHINLLPIAWLASRLARAPLVLVVHGIDAWGPPHNRLARYLAGKVDLLISVSRLTKERFLRWSGLPPDKTIVLPNSIDLVRFQPAPKRAELQERYGIRGKAVIMTMGRLVSAERYKGFDEVLDILPSLARKVPDVRYMIIGDGNDRDRLERKAESLGVREKVIFTGFIPESEKREHYNLADVFAMPSRGEGFGIVFLEAMACGVPVVGSAADGSREALMEGALGTLVDPADPGAIERAIVEALERPRTVDPRLAYFSFDNFEQRVHAILDRAVVPVAGLVLGDVAPHKS